MSKNKMKILLLGDWSGYHLQLAEGLRYHGIDVVVASCGDGFKGYKHDIQYGGYRKRARALINSTGFFKSSFKGYYLIREWLKDYYTLNKSLKKFDVIQLISVNFLDFITLLTLLFRSKKTHGPQIFCSLLGSDFIYWTEGRETLQLPLFDEILNKGEVGRRDNWKDFIKFILVNRMVQGFLGCYEYHYAYHKIAKRLPMVIHPIDLAKLKFSCLQLKKSEKIRIYHGINKGREAFKGSSHILKAFEIANQKYPDEVECIAQGPVPYEEFLETINKMHVVFDQTNHHTHGMAALEAMAIGKIVGTCSQNDAFWNIWCKELGIDEPPPLLALLPDFRQIVKQIEWLIFNKDKLIELSIKGRKYVEQYHDSKKVALLYLERWAITVDENIVLDDVN